MLRSVHITHPAYLEYCRGLLGAMVCIKPPQGAQVGAGGGLLEQVRSASSASGRGQAIGLLFTRERVLAWRLYELYELCLTCRCYFCVRCLTVCRCSAAQESGPCEGGCRHMLLPGHSKHGHGMPWGRFLTGRSPRLSSRCPVKPSPLCLCLTTFQQYAVQRHKDKLFVIEKSTTRDINSRHSPPFAPPPPRL